MAYKDHGETVLWVELNATAALRKVVGEISDCSDLIIHVYYLIVYGF